MRALKATLRSDAPIVGLAAAFGAAGGGTAALATSAGPRDGLSFMEAAGASATAVGALATCYSMRRSPNFFGLELIAPVMLGGIGAGAVLGYGALDS